MQNRRQRQGGFTLVEIMVVIVILGLLATIVGTNVLGARDEADLQKAKTDIKQIQDAVTMFMLQNRNTIPTMEDLISPDDRGRPWLLGDPTDPWGNEYVIREGENRRSDFEVISWGPDTEEGTDDDISSKDLTGRERRER